MADSIDRLPVPAKQILRLRATSTAHLYDQKPGTFRQFPLFTSGVF